MLSDDGEIKQTRLQLVRMSLLESETGSSVLKSESATLRDCTSTETSII